MTQPESPESPPQPATTPAAEAEASPPEEIRPEPEPWTPERATEWNSYYDLYVTLGVLLLVFLVSANKITNSQLWTRLQVGRVIAENRAPLRKDLFSYTEEGAAWVNVPWLFDWSHAVVYKAAHDLSPGDPTDRALSEARADQVAAGALVAINALARLLTALVLLAVRREGPGRWWSAVCVALALGVVVGPGALFLAPGSVILGGIAAISVPSAVAPTTWGLLLLALEVWLLFLAIDRGRRNAAFALVPVFLLWANLDESFLLGLIVLAAAVAGRARPAAKGEASAFPLPTALAVLAACAAVCLVNPSVVQVYRAAAEPFLRSEFVRPAGDVLTGDQLSFFGRGIRGAGQAGREWPFLLGYYLAIVAAGFGSFSLNRRRFSLSRFLMYAAAAVLWGFLKRYAAEFAVVFAATLALNGQEWYHDRFGVRGRVGSGWSLWSVGGRAVTLLLIFVCVSRVLLGGLPVPGFEATETDGQFGFGYDRDDFAFEAADFLKTSPIKGNVLNADKAEGDALIWRAYPARKVFIDNRQHLYPPEVLNRLQEIRLALSKDDAKAWRPLLDRYGVSVVMVPPQAAPRTYLALSESANWVPFYDDGSVVLFGRADAPAEDLAFFKANRLVPDTLAYKTARPTPPSDRPPTPVGWMDYVFRTKANAHVQPHNEAARRWLSADPSTLPDPAHCLLAVREARTALASKPDDTTAFRVLATAYRGLMVQEAALMAGIKLTPENGPRIATLNPRPGALPVRYRQLVTALNFAVQTTPPPRSPEARQELRRLNVELFQLLLSANAIDLARDRLQAVVDGSVVDAFFKAEDRQQLLRDLGELNERVKQIETQMSTLTTEQNLGPVQLAGYAINEGAPGLAIRELEEAERTGTNPALVKPQLLDLYGNTGQPDKAVEMLSSGSIDDPSFGTEPGVSAMRQSRVYFLLGNTDYSGTLWDKYALPRVRVERAMRALVSTQSLLHGEAKATAAALLELPGKVTQQADWEFEAGLARLEGGLPAFAADHFTTALTLSPKLSTRPVIAYYLEKLGKPVPPISGEADPAVPDQKGKAGEDTIPEGRKDAPKDQ